MSRLLARGAHPSFLTAAVGERVARSIVDASPMPSPCPFPLLQEQVSRCCCCC